MIRFLRRVASATVGSVVLAVIVINVADKRADDRRRAVASHCATVGWGLA